jgi:hypothetical protein
MTDAEVLELFKKEDSASFDCGEVCVRCGHNWGFHHGIRCQPNKSTTFMPAYSMPTWVVGDKKSRIAPSKKVYKEECPCGIHPSQCEYHK